MSDYKFGYNAFSINGFFWIWMLPFAFLFIAPEAIIILAGYMAVVLIIGFAMTRKPFLTIDRNGITVEYLFRGRQRVSWEDVGAFRYGVTKGSGKTEKTGWGIVYRDETERMGEMSKKYEDGHYALFIPETYVAASYQEVKDALDQSIKRYVKKEKAQQRYFMDSDNQNALIVGMGLLFIAWAGINIYALILNTLWMPEEWEPIMKLTLVGGERFDGANEWLYGIWAGITFFSLFVIPYILVKKHYKESALALGAGIVYVLFLGFTSLKERHDVFLNCSEPHPNHILGYHTSVKDNVYDSKDRHKSKLTFDLAIDEKNYEVEMNYAKGVQPGMPVAVKIKKGSRGLPIIVKVEISRAEWENNTLGDAYNEISYIYADQGEYDKAIEIIDKAIDLAPEEANYYDSKGEHLYHKGDKDEAIEMRKKCLSLDPTFDMTHESELKSFVMVPRNNIRKPDFNIPQTPSEDEQPSYGETDEDMVYDVVNEMPEFPGGQAALLRWISEHIKYPAIAEENGIQGRIICSFVVECDGSVTNVKVERSIDPSLDGEAVRVLSQMPKWKPGKQNGYPVRVKYIVPVTFKLQ